jgi:hypothetical protein
MTSVKDDEYEKRDPNSSDPSHFGFAFRLCLNTGKRRPKEKGIRVRAKSEEEKTKTQAVQVVKNALHFCISPLSFNLSA